MTLRPHPSLTRVQSVAHHMLRWERLAGTRCNDKAAHVRRLRWVKAHAAQDCDDTAEMARELRCMALEDANSTRHAASDSGQPSHGRRLWNKLYEVYLQQSDSHLLRAMCRLQSKVRRRRTHRITSHHTPQSKGAPASRALHFHYIRGNHHLAAGSFPYACISCVVFARDVGSAVQIPARAADGRARPVSVVGAAGVCASTDARQSGARRVLSAVCDGQAGRVRTQQVHPVRLCVPAALLQPARRLRGAALFPCFRAPHCAEPGSVLQPRARVRIPQPVSQGGPLLPGGAAPGRCRQGRRSAGCECTHAV